MTQANHRAKTPAELKAEQKHEDGEVQKQIELEVERTGTSVTAVRRRLPIPVPVSEESGGDETPARKTGRRK